MVGSEMQGRCEDLRGGVGVGDELGARPAEHSGAVGQGPGQAAGRSSRACESRMQEQSMGQVCCEQPRGRIRHEHPTACAPIPVALLVLLHSPLWYYSIHETLSRKSTLFRNTPRTREADGERGAARQRGWSKSRTWQGWAVTWHRTWQPHRRKARPRLVREWKRRGCE
eukprot:3108222-Rhodomonas_salina.1